MCNFHVSTTFHWFDSTSKILPSKMEICGKNARMKASSIFIIKFDFNIYESKHSWNRKCLFAQQSPICRPLVNKDPPFCLNYNPIISSISSQLYHCLAWILVYEYWILLLLQQCHTVPVCLRISDGVNSAEHKHMDDSTTYSTPLYHSLLSTRSSC